MTTKYSHPHDSLEISRDHAREARDACYDLVEDEDIPAPERDAASALAGLLDAAQAITASISGVVATKKLTAAQKGAELRAIAKALRAAEKLLS